MNLPDLIATYTAASPDRQTAAANLAALLTAWPMLDVEHRQVVASTLTAGNDRPPAGWLTVRQAMRLTGIAAGTLSRWMDNGGDVPTVRIGHARYLNPAALAAKMEARR